MKSRTKLDQERLRKKQEGEAQDYLDAVSQSDEAKAADAIIEKGKEADKAEKEVQLKQFEEAQASVKRKKAEYLQYLGKLCYQLCQTIDWPKGYIWKLDIQEDKMALYFKDSKGRGYGRGIKPVGIPEFDLNAVNLLAWYAENTVDKLVHAPKVTDSGIILPS